MERDAKKKKVTEVFILSLGIRGKAASFSESHNHRGSAKSQVWEPRKRAKSLDRARKRQALLERARETGKRHQTGLLLTPPFLRRFSPPSGKTARECFIFLDTEQR